MCVCVCVCSCVYVCELDSSAMWLPVFITVLPTCLWSADCLQSQVCKKQFYGELCVRVCVCVCVCACVFFKMRFLTTIDFFSCYHLLLVWQSVPTTFADRYKPLAHDCINIKAQCFLWSHPVLIISRKDRNCLSFLLSKGFELNSSTYHA